MLLHRAWEISRRDVEYGLGVELVEIFWLVLVASGRKNNYRVQEFQIGHAESLSSDLRILRIFAARILGVY